MSILQEPQLRMVHFLIVPYIPQKKGKMPEPLGQCSLLDGVILPDGVGQLLKKRLKSQNRSSEGECGSLKHLQFSNSDVITIWKHLTVWSGWKHRTDRHLGDSSICNIAGILILFQGPDMHKRIPCLLINMDKDDGVAVHEDQVSRWLILAAFSAADVEVILFCLRTW